MSLDSGSRCNSLRGAHPRLSLLFYLEVLRQSVSRYVGLDRQGQRRESQGAALQSGPQGTRNHMQLLGVVCLGSFSTTAPYMLLIYTFGDQGQPFLYLMALHRVFLFGWLPIFSEGRNGDTFIMNIN